MYVYNDEDNYPMFDVDGHNPTVYSSLSEMRAIESGINEPEQVKDGCWNCIHFNWKHEACSAGWNNLDDDYYNPDCDDRKLTDYCDEHETDPEADYNDIFGEE